MDRYRRRERHDHPGQGAGAAPKFSWVVTNVGQGIKLKGDFKVTSTAGVASGTWEQETEDKPLYRGTVTGTRGDTWKPRVNAAGDGNSATAPAWRH